MIVLEVVHFNVYNDEELLRPGKVSNGQSEKCGVSRERYGTVTMKKMFGDMLHKQCQARTNE